MLGCRRFDLCARLIGDADALHPGDFQVFKTKQSSVFNGKGRTTFRRTLGCADSTDTDRIGSRRLFRHNTSLFQAKVTWRWASPALNLVELEKRVAYVWVLPSLAAVRQVQKPQQVI